MRRASVLIPTHEHAATLPLAVASVQRQGIDDIEILIVGDGITDDLREVIGQLQAGDARIRFFDFPKGPRSGEIHRDIVLRQAQGRIVCYQSDDDLWLPGHLEAMETALDQADFVGAMQTNVGVDDRVRGYFFDLERPEFSKPWLEWRQHGFGDWASHGFGLAFAGHRLDAYLRLPEGWTTTPDGYSTDNSMWKKFVSQPWCKTKFLRWPVSLHFRAPDRLAWSPDQRAAELKRWTDIIVSPQGAARICRDILTDMTDRLLADGIRLNAALADSQSSQAAAIEELKRIQIELDSERASRPSTAEQVER